MQFPIEIIDSPISEDHLNDFIGKPYDTLIKYVIDIKTRNIALGGEMHADAEKYLLENSDAKQEDIWGANLNLDTTTIEYLSLINIRPADNNPSMEILDEHVRAKVKEITNQLISSKFQ